MRADGQNERNVRKDAALVTEVLRVPQASLDVPIAFLRATLAHRREYLGKIVHMALQPMAELEPELEPEPEQPDISKARRQASFDRTIPEARSAAASLPAVLDRAVAAPARRGKRVGRPTRNCAFRDSAGSVSCSCDSSTRQ